MRLSCVPLWATFCIGTVVCAALVGTVTVSAQEVAQPAPRLVAAENDRRELVGVDAGRQPFDWKAERRECEACPPRSVGKALFQTTIINVLYETANLIRGQVTAKITPKTWWENMSTGWVWDPIDPHRRRRTVPAVGIEGVLRQGRRRHGLRQELGRCAQLGGD